VPPGRAGTRHNSGSCILASAYNGSKPQCAASPPPLLCASGRRRCVSAILGSLRGASLRLGPDPPAARICSPFGASSCGSALVACGPVPRLAMTRQRPKELRCGGYAGAFAPAMVKTKARNEAASTRKGGSRHKTPSEAVSIMRKCWCDEEFCGAIEKLKAAFCGPSPRTSAQHSP
jgi:hypothetical protein